MRVSPDHLVASRRAVVRSALWAVPAVVMVRAAPAFADSGELKGVSVTWGDTAVVHQFSEAADAHYYDLEFRGFGIAVGSDLAGPAQLVVTITFDATDPEAADEVYQPPELMTILPDGPSEPGAELDAFDIDTTQHGLYAALVYTLDAVQGGSVVRVTDGRHAWGSTPDTEGVFAVKVEIVDFDSDVASFATAGAGAGDPSS